MTLSPEDQAKMEKANPYTWRTDYIGEKKNISFNEGYTAAHKDNAETIAKLREARADGIDTIKSMSDGIAALTAERDRYREALLSLRQDKHHECEDGWYSCPKSEEGCSDENSGDECNCGTDAMNKIIDEALAPQGADTQEVCHYTQKGGHLKRECDGAHFTVGQVKNHLSSFAPGGKCPHKDCGRIIVFDAETIADLTGSRNSWKGLCIDAQAINIGLAAEVDKQKKLIDAYMDERTELLGNIDAMIEDRDDAYTKRDKAEAEVGRLREGIADLQKSTVEILNPKTHPLDVLQILVDKIKALTPQCADTQCPMCGQYGEHHSLCPHRADYFETPTQGTVGPTQRKSTKKVIGHIADTPCPECGTVGGGGVVRKPDYSTQWNGVYGEIKQPCPKCGTKEES